MLLNEMAKVIFGAVSQRSFGSRGNKHNRIGYCGDIMIWKKLWSLLFISNLLLVFLFYVIDPRHEMAATYMLVFCLARTLSFTSVVTKVGPGMVRVVVVLVVLLVATIL